MQSVRASKVTYKEVIKRMELQKDFEKVTFSCFTTLRNALINYMPTIVMWNLRILLTFQAYMYHSSIGLFHLSWVISTFLFPDRIALVITVLIMLPIYLWEFITIYAMRTPWLKDQEFFKTSSRFFVITMAYPILEQMLYYFILVNMSFCVSCMFLSFKFDQDKKLVEYFANKIKNSTCW